MPTDAAGLAFAEPQPVTPDGRVVTTTDSMGPAAAIQDDTQVRAQSNVPLDAPKGHAGDWAQVHKALEQWRTMDPSAIITQVVLPFAHPEVPSHWRTETFTAAIVQGGDGSYFRTSDGTKVPL